jgi:hypothetical protein
VRAGLVVGPQLASSDPQSLYCEPLQGEGCVLSSPAPFPGDMLHCQLQVKQMQQSCSKALHV